MTQPKHTHPLGYLQQTAKQLKEYWFLILLALWQWGNLSAFWRLIMVLALVTWLLVWPLLQWLTLTYLIEPTAVVVNSGIFIRHHQHIPYSRIQTVQRKQWFYLRPFHLEALQIETAGHQDDEPEVRLPAVPTTVADTLNAYRFDLPLTTDSVPATAQAAPETATPGLPDIRQRYVTDSHSMVLFALTGTGIIPLALVLLTLYGKLPHQWTDSLISDAAHWAVPLIIGGVILVLLVAWLGAFAWILIRYYHFTLTRTSSQLQVAKGLFQRNTITAPLARVQAVRCKQTILRQWLHLQTVQVLLASKAATDDDNDDLVILPAIVQSHLYTTLNPFIDWTPPMAPRLTQLIVPRPARWLLSRNAVLVVILPVLVVGWLWQPWGWLSALLIPLAILQGQYAARNTAGSLLTHQLLVLQTGHFWTRETFFVRKAQIQSLRVTWSVWMQKRQLAHLTVNIRHGNHNQEITLRYISAKQAERLYQWYKA